VPEKGIFGHRISGIEDIAVDQPKARQVLVARVAVIAHMFARVGAIRYFCNLIKIFRNAT